MSELIRCDLCGTTGHHGREISERIVAWTDEHRARVAGLPTWDTVNRCHAFQACRDRVEAAGQPWPVRDAVTRPTVRGPQQREEVPA
jgi:hypothetical protein